MYELFFKLQIELTPVLRLGDLEDCEQTVINELMLLPDSPFHQVLELKISNSPIKVARFFDKYFNKISAHHTIRAAYTEMNGFSINPDRWYFNVFSYEQSGGHDDYDWLSNPQSVNDETITITGFEPLQKVYASKAFSDECYDDASSLTNLLVVIKFQALIKESARYMKELKFPLLATAHDYDFIYEAPANE